MSKTNKRIAKAKIIDSGNGTVSRNDYIYLDESELAHEGELVAIETRDGYSLGIVIDVIDDEEKIEKALNFSGYTYDNLKKVVGQIDNVDKKLAKLASRVIKDINVKKMEKMVAELDERAKFKKYAEMDDKFAALYKRTYGEEL